MLRKDITVFHFLECYANKLGSFDILRKEFDIFILGKIILIIMIFFLLTGLEPNNEKTQSIHDQRLSTLLMADVGFHITWQGKVSV